MKFEEFKNKVETEYRKILPNSMCNVMVYKCLGRYITIDCYLAGKKEEFPNMISQNDMFSSCFMFDVKDNFNQEEDDLPDEIIMSASRKTYRIKSDVDYLFCSYRNLSYRKTKGDADKIVKSIGKFFDKLRKSLEEDLAAGNIHAEDLELLKEKLNK